MCTSLTYTDLNGGVYFGRTLELDIEEPYFVTYVPVGTPFHSDAEGSEPLQFETKQPFIAVAAPIRFPTKENPLGPSDMKTSEGMNAAGLSFSLLAYPTSAPGESSGEITKSLLDASDLGSWILSQFATVAEVKAGLAEQPVHLTRLALVGNATFPFHIVVHDKGGSSIVIEWHDGKERIYDNPVGVMTNGPDFPWHLTNLRNWTHLTNVDASSAKFGELDVTQPDSGIASASLPGSNTSVGRFIRAVFYSNFTEKTDDPDKALLNLARIMNNFDRPRGATIDPPEASGGEGMKFQGIGGDDKNPPTEYTSWTNLSDLGRSQFLLRTYGSFNYTRFDLAKISQSKELHLLPTAGLDPLGGDGTATLLAAKLPGA